MLLLVAAAWSLWELPNIQAVLSQNLHVSSPAESLQQTPSAVYEIIQDQNAENHQPPTELPVAAQISDTIKSSEVITREIPQTKQTSKIKQSKVSSPACKQLLETYQLTGEGDAQYLKECTH